MRQIQCATLTPFVWQRYTSPMVNRRLFLQTGFAGMIQAQRPESAKTYRVCLIGDTGHGNFGHDWDVAWRTVPNTQVVAVADPDESGRRNAMNRSGAPRGYADYREMLAKEMPNIVTICPRWADQRVAMVTAAAETGAHVLVEKPFASTLGDADTLVTLTERRGIRVQVGHTARLAPVSIRVHELLQEGELGVLMEIRARGKEDLRAGGEDMMVLGTHDFDLMRYFAGDPRWVFADVTEKGRPARVSHRTSELIGPVAGDEIASMFMFANGVHGYFASKASDVQTGKRCGVTLYGSKAVAYLPLDVAPSPAPYVLRNAAWVGEGKSDSWERIGYPPGGMPLTREQANIWMAADLLCAIEQHREPVCSARDGRWAIEMATGIYQSSLGGQRVSFPLTDRR